MICRHQHSGRGCAAPVTTAFLSSRSTKKLIAGVPSWLAGFWGDQVRKLFDVAVMFVSLWLLSSQIIDIITPRELTVWMIGAAMAPSIAVTAALYYLDFPLLDFAMTFSALWLSETIALNIISPKPLHDHSIWIGFALPILVGSIIRLERRQLMSRFLFKKPKSPDESGSRNKPLQQGQRRR
jgi:hypothetical protein